MAQELKGHELIPSARRLIKSLRDMGYDFSTAIADLVDNSIEANASVVDIDVEFDGDNSWVRIADNGKGMDPKKLREAMRYGSEGKYKEGSLGKFGLGLKTASLSQCKTLSVASRINPNRIDIVAYCWDLDHIEKTNRWEVIPIERTGLGPNIRTSLKDKTGTVVLWQNLDRILGYKHPYSEAARRRLLSMCREMEQHLAMVFHRFIGEEVKDKRLKIRINGNEIQPWDPFAREESRTKILTPIKIKLEHEGVINEIMVEPYVLPHQNDFSSPDAFRHASGPANWNQQQGFYIYRANRMIQSGGWCHLRTSDEHTKLARVALSFSPILDDAFKINVAKMRVQLPSILRDQVDLAIKPVIKIAQDTYRKSDTRPSRLTHPVVSVSSTPSSTIPNPERVDGIVITNTDHTPQITWTLEELQQKLEKVAKHNEKQIISRVFARFRKKIN
jgi:hypothetical protein